MSCIILQTGSKPEVVSKNWKLLLDSSLDHCEVCRGEHSRVDQCSGNNPEKVFRTFQQGLQLASSLGQPKESQGHDPHTWACDPPVISLGNHALGNLALRSCKFGCPIFSEFCCINKPCMPATWMQHNPAVPFVPQECL